MLVDAAYKYPEPVLNANVFAWVPASKVNTWTSAPNVIVSSSLTTSAWPLLFPFWVVLNAKSAPVATITIWSPTAKLEASVTNVHAGSDGSTGVFPSAATTTVITFSNAATIVYSPFAFGVIVTPLNLTLFTSYPCGTLTVNTSSAPDVNVESNPTTPAPSNAASSGSKYSTVYEYSLWVIDSITQSLLPLYVTSYVEYAYTK